MELITADGNRTRPDPTQNYLHRPTKSAVQYAGCISRSELEPGTSEPRTRAFLSSLFINFYVLPRYWIKYSSPCISVSSFVLHNFKPFNNRILVLRFLPFNSIFTYKISSILQSVHRTSSLLGNVTYLLFVVPQVPIRVLWSLIYIYIYESTVIVIQTSGSAKQFHEHFLLILFIIREI